MSAELVDPFATHEPGLTPEEWLDIREEIWVGKLDDRALFPDCLVQAVQVLGDIALGSSSMLSRRAASQCLRRLAYRAKNGVPFDEPVEPAWAMDSEKTVPR